jgi:hypothetical protein
MRLDDCRSNLTPSGSANEKIRSRHGLCNEKVAGFCLVIADGGQSAKDHRHGTARSELMNEAQ